MSTNQCDGCRAGMPLADGIHRYPGGFPYMCCTADLYATSSRAEVARALAGLRSARTQVRVHQLYIGWLVPELDAAIAVLERAAAPKQDGAA